MIDVWDRPVICPRCGDRVSDSYAPFSCCQTCATDESMNRTVKGSGEENPPQDVGPKGRAMLRATLHEDG